MDNSARILTTLHFVSPSRGLNSYKLMLPWYLISFGLVYVKSSYRFIKLYDVVNVYRSFTEINFLSNTSISLMSVQIKYLITRKSTITRNMNT